jgi:type IV pilus assembly protein PilE
MRTPNKGFTLIELMIVIAIIGILATVVMPSYRSFVLESQRTDTQGQLLQIIALQERFYVDNFRYTLSLTDLGYDSSPLFISYNDEQAFRVSLGTCDEITKYPDAPDISRCFIIYATALGTPDSGAQVDDGDLLVDNRGRKEHNFAGIVLRDWAGNDL